MTWWWRVETARWVCAVEADSIAPFTIRTAPPLLAKFRGQSLSNLITWARFQPGFKLSHMRGDGAVSATVR